MPKFEITPEMERRAEESLARMAEETRRGLPPPPAHWQRKMDEEARTNAALAQPGPARDAYLEAFPDAEDDA